MPRESYQDQLVALRGEVGAMADLTLERYHEAIEVLDSGDPACAREIIEGDGEINDRYLDIENDCIDLIALQQPVASDLRFIASSFKIVTDIERVGDLATNLARYGRESDGGLDDTVDMTPIGSSAGGMVADAIEAYEHEDAEMARAVAARDDELDDRCREASETVVRTLLVDGESRDEDLDTRLETVSTALLAVRDIERVGDHAVNICARTVYMVEHDDELIY